MEEERKGVSSEQLADAVRFVAWGFLFLYIDVNLGRLNILPNWAGYLMIVMSALPILAEEEESAGLLRVPGILLVIWHLVLWFANLFSISVEIPVLEVVTLILNLYFLFQLLTNLAEIAERYECQQQERLLKLRTTCTLLAVLSYFLGMWRAPGWLLVTNVVLYLILALWLCAVLFSFRRSLSESQE